MVVLLIVSVKSLTSTCVVLSLGKTTSQVLASAKLQDSALTSKPPMLTMHIFNSTSKLFPCINNKFVHIGFHTFKKPYKPILIHEFFQLMTRSHPIKESICLQQEICWGTLIVCKNNLHETGNGVKRVFLNKRKQF